MPTTSEARARAQATSLGADRVNVPMRSREEREALVARNCPDCTAFYERFFTPTKGAQMMQYCSRHRSLFTPPDTPDGYWDLSMRTPEDWVQQDSKLQMEKRQRRADELGGQGNIL